MLCHENMMSYYMDTNNLLFRRKGAFEVHFNQHDLDEMIPFERIIHLIQIGNKIDEYENEKQANKNN